MKSLLRLLTVCLLTLTPSFALAQQYLEMTDDYGVHLYEGENFNGKNVRFNIGVNDHHTEDFRMPFGGEHIGTNKISSIRVGRGLKVTFYAKRYMQGDKSLVLFPGNAPRLLDWDDKIASIRYERIDINEPLVEFFRKTGGYKGNAIQTLGIGMYRAIDGNLLRNDDFAMFSCQKGVIVRVFENDDASAKVGEGGVLLSQSDVFKSGRSMVSLADFGLKDKISAISIERAGYKITKIEMVGTPVTTDLGEQELGAQALVKNASPFPLKANFNLQRTFGETIARSWSNATEAGIEATASVTVSAGVPGVGTAEATKSLTARLANTFTIGNDKSEINERQVSIGIEQEVPSGKAVRIIGLMAPKKVVTTYEYTWEANNGSPSAPTKKSKDTITMILQGDATYRSEGAGDVPVVTGVKEVEITKN